MKYCGNCQSFQWSIRGRLCETRIKNRYQTAERSLSERNREVNTVATSKEYLHFILDQLSDLTEISYRCAFGEYMIYHRGKVAAYLCDNRLLVKPVSSAVRMMPQAHYEPPYEGAKDMLLVENVDDREFLSALFMAMYPELPNPKKK